MLPQQLICKNGSMKDQPWLRLFSRTSSELSKEWNIKLTNTDVNVNFLLVTGCIWSYSLVSSNQSGAEQITSLVSNILGHISSSSESMRLPINSSFLLHLTSTQLSMCLSWRKPFLRALKSSKIVSYSFYHWRLLHLHPRYWTFVYRRSVALLPHMLWLNGMMDRPIGQPGKDSVCWRQGVHLLHLEDKLLLKTGGVLHPSWATML